MPFLHKLSSEFLPDNPNKGSALSANNPIQGQSTRSKDQGPQEIEMALTQDHKLLFRNKHFIVVRTELEHELIEAAVGKKGDESVRKAVCRGPWDEVVGVSYNGGDQWQRRLLVAIRTSDKDKGGFYSFFADLKISGMIAGTDSYYKKVTESPQSPVVLGKEVQLQPTCFGEYRNSSEFDAIQIQGWLCLLLGREDPLFT